MTVHTHPHQLNSTITNGRTAEYASRTGRVHRVTPQQTDRSIFVEPAPQWTSGDVWKAFHGYAIARLSDSRNATSGYRFATAQYWNDHLSNCGFSQEAITRHEIGFIPSLTEAREHLRSLGFSDYDLDVAGLTEHVSAAAGEHRDMLCVPVVGLPGEPNGLALLPRGNTHAVWQSVMVGESQRDMSHFAHDHIAITTDPLEALLLADTGFGEAFACSAHRIGQTSFWESLSDHGVDRVTVVTAAAQSKWNILHDAAQSACDARCTPAVDLYELPHAVGRSVAFYASQIGAVAFREELARRYERPTATPRTFDSVTYWAAIRPEIAAIKDPHQRRAHERLASEVAELLDSGQFSDAHEAIAAATNGTASTFLPRSMSHHVEYVRSASASTAMSKRLFDLLRTTNGHVTIVTPLSHDEYLKSVCDHAANAAPTSTDAKFSYQFAGRTADVLRSELQTFGHRLRVISTPKPFAFSESGSKLMHQTDVILVDATGQADMFWWQENGWAAHLTELAEQTDSDLIAFWPAERAARKVTFRPTLIDAMQRFATI